MKKIFTIVISAMCMLAVPQITYATANTESGQATVITKTFGTVTANSGLNLRKEAGTSSGVITVIPKGSEVEVVNNNGNNWYNVKYNGHIGWVSGDYLTVRTVEISSGGTEVSRSLDDKLIDNALSLIGVPYSFGGTSPSGFDCSGYVQYVFKGSGISLPRTSQEQYKVGTSISKDQLQAGDLVFFSTYASGPSHVGIYIGGGRFVHASSSKGITITPLDSSYYAPRYLGARRV